MAAFDNLKTRPIINDFPLPFTRPEHTADNTLNHRGEGLDNPDFEAGTSGWTLSADFSIIRDPSKARFSNWLAIYNGAGTGVLENDGYVICQSGDYLRTSCFVQTDTGSGTIVLEINVYDKDDTIVQTFTSVSLAANTSWNTQSVAGIVTNVNAAYAKIEYQVTNTTSNEVRVESCLLENNTFRGEMNFDANVIMDRDLDVALELDVGSNANIDGRLTLPGQPFFLAHNGTADNTVTGDGTTVTVEFDQEDFDQGTDFDATTDTFTAPIAGKYKFTASVRFHGGTAALDNLVLKIVGANQTLTTQKLRTNDLLGTHQMICEGIIECDASDTVTVTLFADGEAAKTIDIEGGSDMRTMFCGMLVA